MRKILFIIILFICGNQLQAQTQGKGDRKQSESSLIGTIWDETHSVPLEFATISIYSDGKQELINGAISQSDGSFNIPLKAGVFDIQVDYLSYEMIMLEDVKINANESKDLGRILMLLEGTNLDLVEVRAEKSQMQLSLDKRVFNVGKDLASRGGNVLDVLDQVPSLSVDVEGNVSLRGNTSVRVFIDGRPSGIAGLSGTEALRSVPGDLIDRVEVITNPSARYDAEGAAGIINIILKKERRKGLNGSVSLNTGYPLAAGAGLNLNWRKQKINWFINYGIRYRERESGGKSDQTYLNDGQITGYSKQTEDHYRHGFSNTVRFGADYFLNPSATLTMSAMYRYGKSTNETEIIYSDLDALSKPSTYTLRVEDETEKEPVQEYSLNYEKKFAGKNHKLTTLVQYTGNEEEEASTFTDELINYDSGLKTYGYSRAGNTEGENRIIAQLDYVNENETRQFEMGVKTSLRNIDNDYKVELQDENGQWYDYELLTNIMEYDENIYSAYASYGYKWTSFSFLAGLRSEFSDISTYLKETNEKNPRDYFDLFPTLHLNYEFSERHGVQLSYSRRVRRPHFYNLNPFFTYGNSRNIRRGNPNLEPQYSHSVEGGYILTTEAGSSTFSIYYRKSDQVFNYITDRLEDNTFVSYPENVGQSEDIGLEITFQQSLSKKLRLNGDINTYWYNYSGEYGGETFERKDVTLRGRVSAMLKMPKLFDAQVTFGYRGPSQGVQGKRKSGSSVRIAASRDLLKDKATLTLNIEDPFNTRKRRYEVIEENYILDSEYQWRGRALRLDFSYRINQKKQRQRPQRSDMEFEGEM
jgi:outer membrane receptor protein involved in Fe transport